MKAIALFGSVLLILANKAAPSPQVAAVWAQERAYWQATVDQDDAVYQSLWHPAFLGWPCDEKMPVSGRPPHMVRDAVKRSYAMRGQVATEAPNLVSTFYHAREKDVMPGGKVAVTDYEVTHTWVPTRAGWKIISGMCKHPVAGR
ncbi:nuclear transport factor 2 family protein [Sphingomonas nostoxanthinifaciens]|uniref:nuclear transport factor 2 family protein n=1 Tax=Sphingomonas nostoxanthinifaciens TaxID=2872652 RepID=UPI001CC20BA9|nr:nuclear transport factor 2 family protein [Sphingomonas nostoxanthinifaciens]UAK24102.1 nuclear transport factor 2 family protein [Sphingomonas nostoxanthinifaciens]